MSSCASQRAPLKRTPSIRLGEGIGGRATVVFEETEEPAPSKNQVVAEPAVQPKKRKPMSGKTTRVKKVRREDPGKENIPPVGLMPVRRSAREPRSADLEEIALGLVALRDGR